MFYTCSIAPKQFVEILDTEDNVVERLDWVKVKDILYLGVDIIGCNKDKASTEWSVTFPYAEQYGGNGKPSLILTEVGLGRDKSDVSGVLTIKSIADIQNLRNLMDLCSMQLIDYQDDVNALLDEYRNINCDTDPTDIEVRVKFVFSDLSLLRKYIAFCWLQDVRVVVYDTDSYNSSKVITIHHGEEIYTSDFITNISSSEVTWVTELNGNTLWYYYSQMIQDKYSI